MDERRYARRIRLADVSKNVIDATLCAEDKRFRAHPGVDLVACTRAFAFAVIRGHADSGASTITQQLIKLGSPGHRTIGRKLAEMWLALSLERRWSKDRILEEYLNRLDYGNLQVGIASASRFYFSKPASDLSPAEAALLCGLPKAPGRLDPHANFAAASHRQQWVLRQMQKNHCLDAAAVSRAQREPIHLAPPRNEFEAPHFVDLLLQRKGAIPKQGAAVRTTLDLELNREVENSLNDQLARIADKHAASGAVVVIENATGQVLALAGSGDYFRPGVGQINGAWTPRSPGSAIKAFTYALALERGANPCTVVADVPTEFPTPTGNYAPNNYNHRFYGPVSLRFALGNSLNVAAIRVLNLAGGPEALHRRLGELGLTTLDHSAEYFGLGLTLGNAEVRLLELTNAFATLARAGKYRPYRLLLREDQAAPARRVFDPRAAYLVADMLSDNGARAASFGLESYLRFDFPVACKTGTSSNYRDNWAIGFTPEFTVGVWVGNPDNSPMRGITGVTGAAPVLHDVFVYLHERRGTSWFRQPEGIHEFLVQPLTGREVAQNRGGALSEKCMWKPEPERAGDYDAAGRVVLPRDYASWLESAQNGLGNLVVCEKSAAHLRIIAPAPGTVFFLDPDLPAVDQKISVRAEARGAIEWSGDLCSAEAKGTGFRLQLQKGVHVISARDSTTGDIAQTWIDVRSL